MDAIPMNRFTQFVVYAADDDVGRKQSYHMLVKGNINSVINFLRDVKAELSSPDLEGKVVSFVYHKPAETNPESRLIFVDRVADEYFEGKDLRDNCAIKRFRFDRVVSRFQVV